MQLKYRNQKNAEAVAQFWGKPLDKPEWYGVKALSDEAAEIMIYDVIGWQGSNRSPEFPGWRCV